MEQLALNLYSLLLGLGLIGLSPLLLFLPKTRAGLLQKLGYINESAKNSLLSNKGAIWIHAVSVGEFNCAFPLLQALKEKYPQIPIVISTTTRAGQRLAQERAGNMAQLIYFPFDFPWIIERFLSLIEPKLIIICETELWPNFIYISERKHIPVIVLNGRMSPRSFERYKKASLFFGPILKKLACVGVQSAQEAERYKEIAGQDLQVEITGNLKYDWPALYDENKRIELKHKLGIDLQDLVLIGGSTHQGEEKVILDFYKNYLQHNNEAKNNLRLIIAPRHPERFQIVAKIIEEAGFKVKQYSKNEMLESLNDIYLLDTIGQLANFYSIASLAFVGGSFANIGGHNLLEPYLYAVPVVCGPNLFKTKESAAILSNEKALFIAQNAKEIEQKLQILIEQKDLRKQMGEKGQHWLNNNRGAVQKSLAVISSILNDNQTVLQPNKLETIKR